MIISYMDIYDDSYYRWICSTNLNQIKIDTFAKSKIEKEPTQLYTFTHTTLLESSGVYKNLSPSVSNVFKNLGFYKSLFELESKYQWKLS